MSNESPLTFSESVSKRVREARKARGWSVEDLAARCTSAGWPALTASAIYVLEGPRRRSVTVDEWLVLAHVLEVPPLTLMLPDTDANSPVTPTVDARASSVAGWILGKGPLQPRDPDTGHLSLEHPGETFARRHRYFGEWTRQLPYLRWVSAPSALDASALEAVEEAMEATVRQIREARAGQAATATHHDQEA